MRTVSYGPRAPMIPLEEAQAFVLDAVAPLDPEEVVLDELLGCVAAGVVVAREPSPRFANSSINTGARTFRLCPNDYPCRILILQRARNVGSFSPLAGRRVG